MVSHVPNDMIDIGDPFMLEQDAFPKKQLNFLIGG
jgi:hypothetical protein